MQAIAINVAATSSLSLNVGKMVEAPVKAVFGAITKATAKTVIALAPVRAAATKAAVCTLEPASATVAAAAHKNVGKLASAGVTCVAERQPFGIGKVMAAEAVLAASIGRAVAYTVLVAVNALVRDVKAASTAISAVALLTAATKRDAAFAVTVFGAASVKVVKSVAVTLRAACSAVLRLFTRLFGFAPEDRTIVVQRDMRSAVIARDASAIVVAREARDMAVGRDVPVGLCGEHRGLEVDRDDRTIVVPSESRSEKL